MISYLPCKAAFRPSCLVRRALPSHCRCSPAVAAWVGHSARSGGFADASGEEWWILNGWGDGMFIYVYVSISDYHWLSISLIQKDCSSRNLENWDHDWFHPAGFTNQHLGFYMILPKMWFMIRSSWIQNLPKKTIQLPVIGFIKPVGELGPWDETSDVHWTPIENSVCLWYFKGYFGYANSFGKLSNLDFRKIVVSITGKSWKSRPDTRIQQTFCSKKSV